MVSTCNISNYDTICNEIHSLKYLRSLGHSYRRTINYMSKLKLICEKTHDYLGKLNIYQTYIVPVIVLN